MEALSLVLLAAAALAAPLDPGQGTQDAWQRAAALPAADPARAAAVVAALDATPGPLDEGALRLAWETGVEAARALRLDQAIAIQSALEERQPAAWSGMDLALSLDLSGRVGEADSVLERTIARANSAEPAALGELWSRRGLLWLGKGDERRARDHLGRALARGSRDAALLLAWLDLESGRLEGARAGFRAALYDDPSGAWALRGWGLALLPGDPRRAPSVPVPPEESDR
jgi:hypothetical protein